MPDKGLMPSAPPIAGKVKSIKVKFTSGAKLKRKFGHEQKESLAKERKEERLAKR